MPAHKETKSAIRWPSWADVIPSPRMTVASIVAATCVVVFVKFNQGPSAGEVALENVMNEGGGAILPPDEPCPDGDQRRWDDITMRAENNHAMFLNGQRAPVRIYVSTKYDQASQATSIQRAVYCGPIASVNSGFNFERGQNAIVSVDSRPIPGPSNN